MTILNRALKFLAWCAAFGAASAVVVAAGIYLYLSPGLPSVEALRDVQLQLPLRVYSADDVLIGEFGEKKRNPVTYEQVPSDLISAILAAEDDRFLQHHGVDLTGLLRAARDLLSTGSIQSGGSTITMQVAKNYFLSTERTFTRKFTEILLALRIEQELDKQEILELYVNKIYLGNRAYGVGAAAQVYYGKPIDQLTLAQLAMIAGLPKAPSSFNPLANPKRALTRRDWILGRMLALGSISPASYEEAVAQPVTASYHGAVLGLNAPWAAEMARNEMFERYGEEAYTGGFHVITTIDSKLQASASRSVLAGLTAYDDRHGYRPPEARLDLAGAAADSPPLDDWRRAVAALPAIAGREAAAVMAVADKQLTLLRGTGETVVLGWKDGLGSIKPYLSEDSVGKTPDSAKATFQVGDVVRIMQAKQGWRLAQVPQAQAALISLNPGDGAILAMVGGLDFNQSKFNRVTQAKRQPGSAFKPFLYAAGLQHGFTPASIINDAPVVFEDNRMEATWRPVNSSGRFYGPTRLRKALYLSRNLVSIRLLRSVGLNNAITYVKQFGFQEADLPRDLSLALGTLTISPMELATAYAMLANGGFRISPYMIKEIRNSQGRPVYYAQTYVACLECEADQPGSAKAAEEAGPAAVAEAAAPPPPAAADEPFQPPTPLPAERIMDERVNYLINSMMKDVITRGTATRAGALKRPDLGGKTGTTNGPTDAWFCGYTRSVVATAWLGFDQNELLGRREFGGTSALPIWVDYMKVALADKPIADWPQPDGITSVRIDPETGLLAQPQQGDAMFEIFRTEDVPTEYAHPAGGSPGKGSSRDDAVEEDLF